MEEPRHRSMFEGEGRGDESASIMLGENLIGQSIYSSNAATPWRWLLVCEKDVIIIYDVLSRIRKSNFCIVNFKLKDIADSNMLKNVPVMLGEQQNKLLIVQRVVRLFFNFCLNVFNSLYYNSSYISL